MPYVFLYVILAAFCIMTASLAGVLFAHQSLSGFLRNNLKVLIALASGVFAALAYSLFNEVFEHGAPLPVIFIAALGGAVFLEVMDHLIPRAHHHHHTTHAHPHDRLEARRMLLGDAVHNIADGIILVPAFLAGAWVGVGTAFAIFIHELVQEIAEFFVLKEAGYSTRAALTRNFAASSTILLGVILAASLASVETLEAPLLAFAGGAFVYIILRDLLPSILRSIHTEGRPLRFVVAALLGVGLLLGIGAALPETHETPSQELL